MLYKISWCEQKPTKDGKPKMEATLVGVDESDNAVGHKVSIWGDFPGYTDLMNGGTVEGEIVPAKDPRYLPSLKPQTSGKSAPRAPQGPLAVVKEVSKGVERAQDRREDGIKISATQRDAVLCAVAEFQENRRLTSGGPTLEEYYQKWRAYFWKNYDVSDTDFPPNL